jgi:pre-mRNA-processing factor 39
VQDDLPKLRQAYDAFLAEYPLCFGYWKKYADAEARHGQQEAAGMVYERGAAAVPYSVDMWAHYCAFKLNAGASQEEMEG